MRKICGIALTSLALCATAFAPAIGPVAHGADAEMPVRKRRARGGQAKPARKPNRLTVSRRVRRKHRRAA